MTAHLLLVSLGPIQDFIASARRCQDLWFGSWLLSELSRTVAEAVEKAGGAGCVVFPAGLATADRPGVANKIVARLPDGVDPLATADAARTCQQERLEAIAQRAWGQLGSQPWHRDTALAQVRELMEFLWVAVPLGGDTVDEYAHARETCERRLAAIKNTRRWVQPKWGQAGVPKSSLDGERESVVDETVYTAKWSASRRRGVFGLKGAERLCGIGLLKRLGSDPHGAGEDAAGWARGTPVFHSTSHVAVTPLLERVAAAPDAVADYLDELRTLGLDTGRFRVAADPALIDRRGLRHDGVLLLSTRLSDHFEEHSDLDEEARAGALRRAQLALKGLLGTVDFGAEPCPYYAFLLGDGDRMGVAIDGVRSLAAHRDLGDALNLFSLQCRTIVAGHHGSLVFAGGDDVLALLPLHRVVSCARTLADAFAGAVQRAVNDHWPEDRGDPPLATLSVGVGIGHQLDAMGQTRALAMRAEKEAKKLRNALAVAVSKRSGADLLVAGTWGAEGDPTLPFDRRLAYVADLQRTGALSAKAAHDVDRLADHYQGLASAELVGRAPEIRSLAAELLGRKRQRGGAAKLEPVLVDEILADLGTDPVAGLRRLSQELRVTRLLLDAERDAAGPPALLPPEVP